LEIFVHFTALLGGFRLRVVVHTAFGKNISYLLVNTPFACPYGTYTLQQFMKIIFTKIPAVFQAVIVQYKALNNIFLQCIGSPNTKLGSLSAIHTIAHRYNGIEVKIHDLIIFAILGSCFQNGNN